MTTRRRWGYLVWIIAGIVIAVPEITAAFDSDALPFTTISGMVGHLERRWNWVELVVVASIVFALFSTVRVPQAQTESTSDGGPDRTPGGRLAVLKDPDKTTTPENFDNDPAPFYFAVSAIGACVIVAVATLAAAIWWDDKHHYRPSYVLYGSLALLWLVIPSVVAFARGQDVPFPTLFRTVTNLEDWLKARPWPHRLGPKLGWLVAYVILAGLVILLLHLTFYPYPDITHIINPNG